MIALSTGVSSAQETSYQATNESLVNYQVPEWYQDAKFGIWAHWGVYSVPAFGGTHAAEWYPRHMYDQTNANGHYEHHQKTYGDNTEFGYKDFIPMFKAEKFDANQWMDLAENAGAKFYTVVSMHHDGFAMYDSEHTKWNAAKMGPKRDLTKELIDAARARGLRTGISNHFAFNNAYYDHMFKFGGDWAEEYEDLYGRGSEKMDEWGLNRWWNVTTELVDKYSPDLYYFDWGWNNIAIRDHFVGQPQRFAAYYYNHAVKNGQGSYGAPGVVMNFKGKVLPVDAAVQDYERGGKTEVSPNVWQCDTSISKHSWSYSVHDDYWPSDELVDSLIDVVSKNGVMMLNFGPKADGTIPAEYSDRLLDIGSWLKQNGESIYATRPFDVFGEGPTVRTAENRQEIHRNGYNYGSKDIRFTRSKDNKDLFAIALGWPEDGKLTVTTLGKGKFDLSGLKTINLVGSDSQLSWSQDEQGLHITCPEKGEGKFAYPFKLSFGAEIPKLQAAK
ncbi:alpha-L-fucosidase [Persicirhabdus sediminis]|nr:alpha-L-fucosidase [Persicirhabdus sediminis]